MMAYASVVELGLYLKQDLSSDSHVRTAELLLDAATSVIDAYAPKLQLASPTPPIARTVCLAVAGRAWTNPTGVQSESVGEYSVVYGVGGLTKGAVQLDRAEQAQLRGWRGTAGVTRVLSTLET